MSGKKPFKNLTKGFSDERRAKIEEKKSELREEMALQELRLAIGVSQEELAKQLNVLQPAIAKIEKRSDIKISSLSKMIEAMGGTLEIKAHFPYGDVTITNYTKKHPTPPQ